MAGRPLDAVLPNKTLPVSLSCRRSPPGHRISWDDQSFPFPLYIRSRGESQQDHAVQMALEVIMAGSHFNIKVATATFLGRLLGMVLDLTIGSHLLPTAAASQLVLITLRIDAVMVPQIVEWATARSSCGRRHPALASWSARSLLYMSQCPGIHWRRTSALLGA